MAKKSFADGLGSLVTPSGPTKAKAGKVAKVRHAGKVAESSTREGTKEGERRATFIVQDEHLDKIKGVAYWDRKDIKEVVSDAFAQYLTKYEKDNGKIKIPGNEK